MHRSQYLTSSVADAGISRILNFIHPGSRILDPGYNNSTKRGGEIYFVLPFVVPQTHRYHKIANNLIFKQVKKFFLAKTLGVIVLVIKLSKIWILNPGSGKNLFRIPDPGLKRHLFPEH
jgi:hypothetical protein